MIAIKRCGARIAVIVLIVFVAGFARTSQKSRPESTAASLAALHKEIDARAESLMPKVIAWRRDFHQHPELGNREVRTAGIVAAHLRALGIDVQTGVAHTGVVGILKGGKPGPVVALRADMDALPVTEEVDVPFKSTVQAVYNGRSGVMHACGHDMHTAMLMGVAEVLAGVRDELPGHGEVHLPARRGRSARGRGRRCRDDRPRRRSR